MDKEQQYKIMLIDELKILERDLRDRLNGILANVSTGSEGDIGKQLEMVQKILASKTGNKWLPHD